MSYWIVSKHPKREYVSGFNKVNQPIHTDDKNKAYKFYDFNQAMSFFGHGYMLSKKEDK